MGRTIFRYISVQYLINVLVLHVFLFGFVVTIDVFINLRRFISGAREGLEASGVADPGAFALALTTAANVADLWWPRLLQLSMHVTGLVLIAAMGFTCVQLVRQRELVALLASGVSLHRLATPFLAVALAITAVQVVNMEVWVPSVAEKLTRSPGEAGGEGRGTFAVELVPDGAGRYFSAPAFDARADEMRRVSIFERDERGVVLAITTAATARYDAAAGGWRLAEGRRRFTPAGLEALGADRASAATAANTAEATGAASRNTATGGDMIDPFAPSPTAQRGDPGDLLASDADGRSRPAVTAPVEFVASPLDPDQLKVQNLAGLAQNLSWRQLGRIIDDPALRPGDAERLNRIRWGRLAALVSNLLALVATLPFFLTRTPTPMVRATVRAFPIAGLGLVAAAAAPNLALPGLPVAIAVFVPSLVLAPIAIALFTGLRS